MRRHSNLATWLPLSLPILLVAATFHTSASPNTQTELSIEEKIKLALPNEAPAKAKKRRTLLIFSATAGFRHQSIPTGQKSLTLLGKHTKTFEVVVSNDLKNFEADNLKKFDAVCFLNTTHNVFSPSLTKLKSMTPEQRKMHNETEVRLKRNLLNFISNGKGFIGIHAASDTFHQWPEYSEMLGAQFDNHPWRSSTPVSIKVEDGMADHPLVASWNGENQSFKEEIYQFKESYSSKKVNLLLRLDTEKSDMKVWGIKRKDKDFGVSWTKNYGKGRVFYCSLGHNHHIYWNPKVLEHYLAGIQYAFGDLDITQPNKK